MFLKMIPARVWWFGLLLIAILGASFYFVLGRPAKSAITSQLLNREGTVARAEASNITSFFQVFGDSIAVLAQLDSIGRGDSLTKVDMDKFVSQWRDTGLVGGIALTDRKGIVRLNSNDAGMKNPGVSLTDRDYFLWAKNQPAKGEYFVGRPVIARLGATKGQMIVPVAAPVYQNGIFTGVFVASVNLESLTVHYLGLMKVTEATNTYLVHEDGELLYSSTGQDVPGTVKSKLNISQEGSLRVGESLVAYSPVLLGSQIWSIIMISPFENVSSLTTPTYIRQTSILLLVALTLLIFGILVARETQIKRD